MRSNEYVNLLNQLENNNLEYVNLFNDFNNLKNKNIKYLLSKKIFKSLKFHLYIKHKLKKIKHHEIKDNNFQIDNSILTKRKIPKIAVYTCITGNYDEVIEPSFISDNIDYYLFTDNSNIKSNNWKIKLIKRKEKNNILLNRYYKMHPNKLFNNKDYDYSIYIDGNIKVLSDLTTMVYSIDEKTGVSFHRHVLRDCVYEEGKACIFLGKGNKNKIVEQLNNYKIEGFPKEYGLLECGVIVTDLNNSIQKEIYNNWWKDFILRESYRDQLSLVYVLWKMNIPIRNIGSLGNNAYKNPKFLIKKH